MPVSRTDTVLAALKAFANSVRADADLGTRIRAGPEDQLKRSVPELFKAVGKTLNLDVSVLSESPVDDVGRPDLAIAVNGLLVGYIELKAPGHGTTDRDFHGAERGHFGVDISMRLPQLGPA